MNIFVSNLSFKTTSEELKSHFSQHGTVESATIINDKQTQRSRGFGFVEMTHGGEDAIAELNDKEFQGRKLTVSVARERVARNERA